MSQIIHRLKLVLGTRFFFRVLSMYIATVLFNGYKSLISWQILGNLGISEVSYTILEVSAAYQHTILLVWGGFAAISGSSTFRKPTFHASEMPTFGIFTFRENPCCKGQFQSNVDLEFPNISNLNRFYESRPFQRWSGHLQRCKTDLYRFTINEYHDFYYAYNH